jgi:hypothetical protein
MAELTSPGVSISVTDESFYAAAGTGTVPLIIIATAQDKSAPAGSTAAFTASAEAGNVKLITSQRELLTNYGNPAFKASGGTQLHGHELNEYGLMAAYSFLGLANRAYVLRADLDLGQLEARSSAPTSRPNNGAYWLDTSATVWGLKQFNGSAWVKQTVKQPSSADVTAGSEPKAAFGVDGDYCVVYQDAAGASLADTKLYNKLSGTWYHIGATAWDTASGSKDFQIAPHTSVPTTKSGGGALASGDLYLQTNKPNNGTDVVVKVYNSSTGQWVLETVEGKEHSYQAFAAYPVLTTGDIWVDYSSADATVSIKRHNGAQTLIAQSTSALSDTATSATAHTNGTTAVKLIVNDRDDVNGASGEIAVTFHNFDVDTDGFLSVDEMVAGFNSALSTAVAADTFSDKVAVANVAGKITITSSAGYDLEIKAGTVGGFDPTDLNLVADTPYSNWEALSFEASTTAITGTLTDGTLWYDSVVSDDSIDILYNNGGTWATWAYDVNVAASEPTVQSDGASALVDGDIWVDSSDLENYPKMYKRASALWVAIDNTDQVSDAGIVFADFRASASASVDADAPNADLYPTNILAWNKRASGGNVKQWNIAYTVAGTLIGDRWVDYSGQKADGSPYMLRKAQRRSVVQGLQSAISTNQEIRNETNRFNLIASPGYPELADEMIALNVDRKETAFIVADAPFRLAADSSSTAAWANNSNVALENGEDGLLSSSPYMGVYYPHGLSSNLDGSSVAVPGSHIALRTIAYNDQVSFPWFAPAGFQRGLVSNASGVGYIDATTGKWTAVSLSEGQRDSLYSNKINPIGNFPGRGLAVFGQKTLNPTSSALDRVNVARLVVYIRERLDDIVKPFLFEPNDEVTRQNAKVLVDRFLGNLVTQRGLFDFLTVCDTSNNTPARIDRNELHVDIAIQPVKSVEFIYIPIRVQNTLGQTG